MNPRILAGCAVMMLWSITAAANAQSAPSPAPTAQGTSSPAPTAAQSAPSPAPTAPGAANPGTIIQSAGGATTLPPGQSLPVTAGSTPAPGDTSSGNVFTASDRLGPQQRLGQSLQRPMGYLAGDFIVPPIVSNPFSPGNRGSDTSSFDARGAIEIPFSMTGIMLGGDYRSFTYPHNAGFVNGVAAQPAFFLPATALRSYDVDARVGVKLIDPRIYLGVSYLKRVGGGDATVPAIYGIGYGLEKLPDLDRNFSLHGGTYYYPNVGNRLTLANGTPSTLSYRVLRYSVGASIQPQGSPVFIDGGYIGERGTSRTNAPGRYYNSGPYLGLGLHF